MTKDEVISALRSSDLYVEDRWGNFRFVAKTGEIYRIKLNAISLRVEAQINYDASQYSPASKSWMKLRRFYYKDITNREYGLVLKKTNHVIKLR